MLTLHIAIYCSKSSLKNELVIRILHHDCFCSTEYFLYREKIVIIESLVQLLISLLCFFVEQCLAQNNCV